MSIGFGSFLLTFIIVFSLAAQASGEFSDAEKFKLLKSVNVFRANIATRKPPAANLQEVFWDGNLAALARRDVVQCGKGTRPKPAVGGVEMFLQNNSTIKHLIKCLRQDLVTRPYLIKATFNRMGCALSSSCCGTGNVVLCYWYPLCGTLYNAFEEGPLACSEFYSAQSRNYKQLCVRSMGFEEGRDICAHKSRSKPADRDVFVGAKNGVAKEKIEINSASKSDSKSDRKKDSKSDNKSDRNSNGKSDKKDQEEEKHGPDKKKTSVMKFLLW